MNMFKPTKSASVKEYINSVPEDRKALFVFLHEFIQKHAPKQKVHFANNMIGYGSFEYINYKKEKIMWPTIALANQKNYISLYVCGTDNGTYIAEKYKDKLGKVSVGKSCIRIKKLEDIDQKVLQKVIKEVTKHPGFVQ